MSDDQYPPGQSRDPADLLKNITDANIPKSETEWAAHAEIERLRAELAELRGKRQVLATINKLLTILNTAPHAVGCPAAYYRYLDACHHWVQDRRDTILPELCTCWKSEIPTEPFLP